MDRNKRDAPPLELGVHFKEDLFQNILYSFFSFVLELLELFRL